MQLNQTISLNGPTGEELSAQIMPDGDVSVCVQESGPNGAVARIDLTAAELRAWCLAVLKGLADA